MASDREIAHLRRLRQTIKEHRDELEIQIAQFGAGLAPAHLVIQFREDEESIARIDAKLALVTVPLAVQEATGPEASIDVLRHNVKDLREFFHSAMRTFNDQLIEMREDTREWREQQAKERRAGTRERRAIEVVLAVGVIVAIYLAVH
jgi:hypothetical protein